MALESEMAIEVLSCRNRVKTQAPAEPALHGKVASQSHHDGAKSTESSVRCCKSLIPRGDFQECNIDERISMSAIATNDMADAQLHDGLGYFAECKHEIQRSCAPVEVVIRHPVEEWLWEALIDCPVTPMSSSLPQIGDIFDEAKPNRQLVRGTSRRGVKAGDLLKSALPAAGDDLDHFPAPRAPASWSIFVWCKKTRGWDRTSSSSGQH